MSDERVGAPSARLERGLVVAYALGLVLALLGATSITRLVDLGMLGLVAAASCLGGALVGWRWLPAATRRGRGRNAVFGAVALVLVLAPTFALVDVELDRSERVEIRASVIDVVAPAPAGRVVIVDLGGGARAVPAEHALACAPGDEARLRLGQGLLGARWVESLRCDQMERSIR